MRGYSFVARTMHTSMVVKNTAVYRIGCSKKLSNIPPLKMMSGMIANSQIFNIAFSSLILPNSSRGYALTACRTRQTTTPCLAVSAAP